MIKYKKNILEELKKRGYSTYSLVKSRTLSNGTIQKIREKNTKISIDIVDTLCRLLSCDISDILEYVPDDAENIVTDPKIDD